MEAKQAFNHNLATVGNSLLLVWWGAVIIVDPLTLAMGAFGSGLILLGVNAVRMLSGIPTKGSTTTLGIIALTWGALDWVFNPPWDKSLAMLLIIVGLVALSALWDTSPREAPASAD